MGKIHNRVTIVTELENANVITNSGPHYAGDVFATAILSMLKRVRVLRTKDQSLVQYAKKNGPRGLIMFGIGGEFRIDKRRFDCHQEGFEEHYSDFMKLSTAGLAWRHYSMEILSNFDCPLQLIVEATMEVSHDLIHGVDASDQGYSASGIEMSVSEAINLFNPNWNDQNQDSDVAFLQAVSFAQKILEKEIKHVVSVVKAKSEIENMIAHNEGEFLYLPMYIDGWEEYILRSFNPKAKKLLYCVFPNLEGEWNVQAILGSRDNSGCKRKKLPTAWCGLSNVCLASLTGVQDVISCEADGTLVRSRSLAGALALAQIAISS